MKRSVALNRLLFTIILSVLSTCISFAQITLDFSAIPTVSGAAGAVGTKYTWPNSGISHSVTIKTVIEIKAISGGAILQDIDESGFGYDEAWQPIINGPNTPSGGCW